MWKKIKKWLIKKLGGYESPNYLDFCIKRSTHPVIPIVVDYVVDTELCDDEEIEYIKQRELVPLLAEKMIENNLVDIRIEHIGYFNGRQAIVRASCEIVDQRGK